MLALLVAALLGTPSVPPALRQEEDGVRLIVLVAVDQMIPEQLERLDPWLSGGFRRFGSQRSRRPITPAKRKLNDVDECQQAVRVNILRVALNRAHTDLTSLGGAFFRHSVNLPLSTCHQVPNPEVVRAPPKRAFRFRDTDLLPDGRRD